MARAKTSIVPALSPTQIALKQRIDAAQAEVTRTNRLFADAVEARTRLQLLCTDHVAVALGAGGAICAICMTHLGWFCEPSPDHVCHYADEAISSHTIDEACIHCGQPEERT